MASPLSPPVEATWTCLSAHVPADGLAAAGERLLGRSSNAAGIVGDWLLVFSGENTPRVPIDDCVHVFDLVARKWSRIDKKAGEAWPCARIGHAGATVGSALYISGGRTAFEGDQTLDDLWKFDTETSKWTSIAATGEKPPPLSYHVFSSAGDKLFLFGGCLIDHGRSNGLWQLCVKTAVWTQLSSPSRTDAAPSGRGGPGLAAFENEVYVAFGYNGKEEQQDLWRFDLLTKNWTELKPTGGVKPAARSVTDLVALPSEAGSKLFAFGGEFTPSALGHDGAGEYHADAWVYDLKANAWTESKPSSSSSAPVARGWFNSMRYNSGVVVFGGFDGEQRRNDVYEWKQ